MMTIDTPVSLSDTQYWFSKNALNITRRDFVFIICREDRDGELAAMGGLTGIDFVHRNAELYVMVSPTLVGRGIGRASVQWLCNYGFSSLGLNRIYLHTLTSNARAIALYEGVGFSHEGTMRKHVRKGKKFVDRHMYSILRDEWVTQPWCAEEVLLEVEMP
jgi:diamine N-acetyltransferase